MWQNRISKSDRLQPYCDAIFEERPSRHPLHTCVYSCQLKLVRHVFDGGADINVRHAIGLTPVMPAAEQGRIEILDLLRERKADSKVRNLIRGSVLHGACARGQTL